MAEEVKETMEQFETQLEESLNKAATNEDAVWNHLEELKESGEVLALMVESLMVELLFMLKESVDLFQHLYYQQNMLKI